MQGLTVDAYVSDRESPVKLSQLKDDQISMMLAKSKVYHLFSILIQSKDIEGAVSSEEFVKLISRNEGEYLEVASRPGAFFAALVNRGNRVMYHTFSCDKENIADLACCLNFLSANDLTSKTEKQDQKSSKVQDIEPTDMLLLNFSYLTQQLYKLLSNEKLTIDTGSITKNHGLMATYDYQAGLSIGYLTMPTSTLAYVFIKVSERLNFRISFKRNCIYYETASLQSVYDEIAKLLDCDFRIIDTKSNQLLPSHTRLANYSTESTHCYAARLEIVRCMRPCT